MSDSISYVCIAINLSNILLFSIRFGFKKIMIVLRENRVKNNDISNKIKNTTCSITIY
jgi:hypothetical protein